VAKISIDTYRKIFLGVILVIITTILVAVGVGFFIGEKTEVTINSVPQGSSVEFKGKTYKTPLKLKGIKEGSYTIKFSKEGYFERKEKISVSKTNNTFLYRLYTLSTAPSVLRFDLMEAADVKQSDLEKLVQYLPYMAENYRIESELLGSKPVVTISLYARLTKASQIESFKQNLKAYGEEALKWIRSKEVNPQKLTIIWKPRDPFK
jgi:hypothetical protein